MNEITVGTDGARAPWGDGINADTGYRIGVGTAEALGIGRVVLVQDTRHFNPELAEAVTAGLHSRGVLVEDAGILPTPAAAIIAHSLSKGTAEPVGAISLSASHNPGHDAGIKVFGAGGVKLTDAETRQVEKYSNLASGPKNPQGVSLGRQLSDNKRTKLRRIYPAYLLSTVSPSLRASHFLSGTKVVLDTANGAAYESALQVFGRLGARVEMMNDVPSDEINRNCGATHPEVMRGATDMLDADYGFAFDGDADRVIGYDRRAQRLIDGDDALAIAAIGMIAAGKRPNGVAATAYSNLGLERLLKDLSVPFHETDNGDRYVLEAMRRGDLPFGGENSGHTLYADTAQRVGGVLTGDGTLTALQELQTAAQIGRTLGEISGWPKLPHVLRNVHLSRGTAAKGVLQRTEVTAVIDKLRADFNGVLHVRASGTEPVIRVLVKGTDVHSTENAADRIESTITGSI